MEKFQSNTRTIQTQKMAGPSLTQLVRFNPTLGLFKLEEFGKFLQQVISFNPTLGLFKRLKIWRDGRATLFKFQSYTRTIQTPLSFEISILL